MKTFNIAPAVVMFVLGVIVGFIISQLNGIDVQPTLSVDQRSLAATPPALIARFDQMEARLGELTAALNRVDGQTKGVGQPNDERLLSANGPNGREKRVNDLGLGSAPNAPNFAEIKGRVFNSLQDTATNFTTLMHSNEMQTLSKEQQDEVMREVAAQLDSGQLSKEQFLPGYKPKTGPK